MFCQLQSKNFLLTARRVKRIGYSQHRSRHGWCHFNIHFGRVHFEMIPAPLQHPKPIQPYFSAFSITFFSEFSGFPKPCERRCTHAHQHFTIQRHKQNNQKASTTPQMGIQNLRTSNCKNGKSPRNTTPSKRMRGRFAQRQSVSTWDSIGAKCAICFSTTTSRPWQHSYMGTFKGLLM